MLAFGFDPPSARPRHAFVEGVAEELPKFLIANRAALPRKQAQGGQAPQDVGRGLAGRDGLEALAHQHGALAVVDDDLPTFGGAIVAEPQGSRPGPETPGDGLPHAGGDLLRPQLVVELVEDGKDALDGPARRGVFEWLCGGAELGSGLAEELLEGGVDVDVPGESAGVVDYDVVHGALAQIFQHAAERRPVRRLGTLALLAVDGLDLPAVPGTVLAAGLFLDVEGQVGDLFLGGDSGVDDGLHG